MNCDEAALVENTVYQVQDREKNFKFFSRDNFKVGDARHLCEIEMVKHNIRGISPETSIK